MKIALLTDGIYPYVIGGMQKHSYYLAKYFAKNKIHVDLYHFNQSEFDIDKLELFSGEEKEFIRPFVIDFPDFGKLPGHYIRESFEYSMRIFELFKANSEVDFIYVKGFSGWKLIDEKRKGYKCAPVGVNFHGYEMFQKAPSFKSRIAHSLLLQRPVLFNIENADYVFSYGGKISDIILKLGVEKNNIIETRTGIEQNWINANIRLVEKKRKFVFIGRYERRKGIEELNQALKDLIHTPDFEMHFIGPIPKLKQIVSDIIFYHGSVSDADTMKMLLRSCDLLICPSYSEGMPNVILEAMASGLAIIATDVGAVNLMVSRENGRILSSPDSKHIMDAMSEMINIHEKDLMLMKEASVKSVKEKYLWDEVALDTINAIKKCVY